MATVLDALYVTLGLDPKGFQKGQKQVEDGQRRMRQDSERTQKQMDLQSKRIAEGIEGIRNQVIGLFAAFTAGKGLKDFISSLTNTDAATGRLAKNIGMSVDQLTAWQGVVTRNGGTAEGFAASVYGLRQQFEQLALTGQSAVVPYFRAIGVTIADSAGKMRPMQDILLDLSDRFSHLDPAKAQAIGAGMGLDRDTVNTLIQGRAAMTALLAEQEKIGHASRADAAAAQQRQAAFRSLGQASEDLGRKLLTAATPAILAITKALTQFSEWAAKHRPLVEAAFIGLTVAVTAFAAVLAAPLAGLAALSAAIAAAVAAIALLYDDWKTWTEGGKSAFAGFWQFFADKWAEVRGTVLPVIEALKAYILDLVQTWKDAWALIFAIFTGSSADIRGAFQKLTGDLGKDFLDFVNVIKRLGPLLVDAFKEAFSAAFSWLEGRFSAVKGAITGIFSSKTSAAAGPTPKTAPAGASDIDKFVAMGWTREQAAGIVASLQRESGGNERAVGDNGQAYGLFQWHKDRQAAFAQWAGHDISQSSRDEQLAFANYELRQGSEKAAGARLAQATDAAAAGAIVSRYYERPRDQQGEASARSALAASLAAGPTPDRGLATGTGAGAQLAGSVSNDNSKSSTSTVTNQVTVGSVTVNSQATDAKGIAQDFGAAVSQFSFAAQANYGLAG